MNQAFSLESALNPVLQPVIGTSENKIIYANPAAITVFGESLCEKMPEHVFPPEILENRSISFFCIARILGKSSKTFVCRYEGFTLYYIDVDPETGGSLFFTRRMLSHLRTCVTGIKIAADRCFFQLEDDLIPDGKIVSVLYHYYYRLARTIIQMDSADKLERREMTFSPEPSDLVLLCSELTDTMMNLSREKEIKIVFSAEDEHLAALVDSSLIELMLLNLLSNSLKNVESGNTLEFGIKQSHGKIVISLDDDGRGIPQNKLSEIFSLPADGVELDSPDEGIGLGLYIAHEIVQLHNGVLLFESREGEGVHIRVLLPSGEETATTFNSPSSDYSIKGISGILTGLADVLSSDCYGPKYED